MLGLSLAPATGRLIAELITSRSPHIDPGAFSPSRFGRT
jgi:D-amino-acid dehydrogenase